MAPCTHLPEPSPALAEWLAKHPLPEDWLLHPLVQALRAHCPGCARNLNALARIVRQQARGEQLRPRVYGAEQQGLLPAEAALPFARRRAAKQLAALAELPHRERLAKVERARTRYRSPALVEEAFHAAHRALGESVEAAAQWLDLAKEVILRLHAASYPPAVTAALSLRLAARRANLLRVASDLPGADRAWSDLRRDRRLMEIVSPSVHGELASLEASLRQDQRRFSEAKALLSRAAGLFRAVDSPEGVAKVLLQAAIILRIQRRFGAALEQLAKARKILTKVGVPSRIELMVEHNRALCFSLEGDFSAARRLFEAAQPLYEQFRTAERTRLEGWLKGRIAAGLGESEAAETAFHEVRTSYLTAGLPLDAALVTLDLAELHLAQGHLPAVQELAQETLEVFHQQDVPAEAARAIALLAQAAATERLSLALLARLRRGLGGRA